MKLGQQILIPHAIVEDGQIIKLFDAACHELVHSSHDGLIKANDVTSSGRPLGRKIDGVEVTLKTRMSYRGLELRDRTSPSHRYFRFPRVPFMAISKKDIHGVKDIKIYEGEIYSAKERYRMKLAVSPAKSAENHYRTGEWCMANELVEEASDHFAKCQLLDGSYVDRCKDKMPLIKELAKK